MVGYSLRRCVAQKTNAVVSAMLYACVNIYEKMVAKLRLQLTPWKSTGYFVSSIPDSKMTSRNWGGKRLWRSLFKRHLHFH